MGNAVSEVDISAYGTVCAADVQHKLVVDKDPYVVVPSEIEFHVLIRKGIDAVLGHGEIDAEFGAEAEIPFTYREKAIGIFLIAIPFKTASRFGGGSRTRGDRRQHGRAVQIGIVLYDAVLFTVKHVITRVSAAGVVLESESLVIIHLARRVGEGLDRIIRVVRIARCFNGVFCGQKILVEIRNFHQGGSAALGHISVLRQGRVDKILRSHFAKINRLIVDRITDTV